MSKGKATIRVEACSAGHVHLDFLEDGEFASGAVMTTGQAVELAARLQNAAIDARAGDSEDDADDQPLVSHEVH